MNIFFNVLLAPGKDLSDNLVSYKVQGTLEFTTASSMIIQKANLFWQISNDNVNMIIRKL